MFMFFGDSHSRQFQSALPGKWAHIYFSGATIKGLSSHNSAMGHGVAVRELSSAAFRKNIYLMFGGVDMDVTFYRKLALGEDVTEAEFFADRADSYARFVEHLLWLGDAKVASVTILAPQLTPLSDAVFVTATASMAKVDPDIMKAVWDRGDCAHLERCRRQARFNDSLQASFERLPVNFARIDRAMADPSGLILDCFLNRRPADHHANQKYTLPLWQRALREFLPAYARVVRRLDERAGISPGDAAGA